MRRVGVALTAGVALMAATAGPSAHAAAPANVPVVAVVSPAQSGAECQWGTEPARVIPPVNYGRGYLFGGDWRRDTMPDGVCALGPAWTPLRHNYPHSQVIVNETLYGGAASNSHMCRGLDDPTCSPADWAEVYAESAMGHCDSAESFNCISAIQVISPDGAVQDARFVRGFPETPGVPEFDQGSVFMPEGGSVPLWEYNTPSGPAQMLSVGMTHTVFRPAAGRWSPSSSQISFSFGLRPVTIESRPAIPQPTLVERTDPVTQATKVFVDGLYHPDAAGCAAISAGECAVDAAFPADYRYRVTMQLRDESAMYLNGAVDEPIIYSEKIPGGHRFVMEASPMPVLGLAGWIPKAQIPRTLVDQVFSDLGFNYNWDVDVYRASYHGLGRGGDQALRWLEALMPYFGDRASFIVDAWYVENTPTVGQYTRQCVDQGSGEFIGIVSSNATAYTGDPPRYDASSGTLSYEVAGPHYMPDGSTLSRGRYSISMNSNFVKCLLGVDKVPTSARVELIYPDGEASAATLAVKQDRNWLRLYYENFTFSSPTVSVRFPKSLTCFKGKGKRVQSKSFTAFECPKGWRPKR